MNDGVVSLSLSSRAWLPATDPTTDRLRPLCEKHTPHLLEVRTGLRTRSTLYRCRACGALYDVVEVVTT